MIGGSSRLDRTELRDRHLVVRQQLQQKGLERLVRPIELIDQQDRRTAITTELECLQQRPPQKIVGREDILLDIGCRDLAMLGFGNADVEQLARIVPFVDRRRRYPALRNTANAPKAAPVSRLDTLAISVLPTPASPSSSRGRPRLQSQRNTAVADA